MDVLLQQLVDACSTGDPSAAAECLQQCLQYGIDLNFVTEEGLTLVSHTIVSAASHPGGGYIDVVQLLLQAGIFLESADPSYGRTAAHWAAYTGQTQMLGLLLMAGSTMAAYDLDGQTAFHAAVISQSLDCISVVLQLMSGEASSILEIANANGLTPLMLAVQHGHQKICLLLLEAGSNPDVVEESTLQSALHMAAERGYPRIVELLLKHQSRLDSNDATGATPVHIAATLVQSSVLDTICNKVGSEVLDIQDALGLTALMHACISGSEECVKFILKKKIDILMKDPREGKTCLHLAAESVSSPSTIIQMLCRKRRQLIEETDIYGRTPLHLAAMSGNFEGLKALYAEGCNLNAIDTNEQYTALHWAAAGGQADALAELLSLGCSSHEMDKNGATALHLASQAAAVTTDEAVDSNRSLGALECIKVLLDSGLSVDVVDNSGQQPIHWALQCPNNQDCLELLIAEGADPTHKDNEGLSGLHTAAKYGATDNCQYLIETAGIHGNIEDSHGQTPLFFSVESQFLPCMEYLLSIGSPPNHRNKDQRSPAHIAASIGSVEGLQLLKQYGANFNLLSNENATPLHDASANGHAVALQFLLESGCDPNIGPSESTIPSPLHFAVSGGHTDCVDLLIQHGAKINSVMLTEEGQPLSPLDYAADNPAVYELIQSNGGLPGSELYTPPPPAAAAAMKDSEEGKEKKAGVKEVMEKHQEEESEVKTKEEVDEERMAEEQEEGHEGERDAREETMAEKSKAEEKEEKEAKKDPVIIIQVPRMVHSRPTSGVEVFDHITPEPPVKMEDRFSARKPNVLSRALSLLRTKSPPPGSIFSSTLGLYGAQATMIAAAIIGTPLGEKTIEIASKVAKDAAEELKKQAEGIDYELPELDWILEPEKEPTPPPEPTPEVPPTPPPTPPPKVEIKMDEFERRMRKAKAQMDETKSLGYRAVEELLRAQRTQAQLKRQFVMASVKEECEKRREKFLAEEAKAQKETEKILNQYHRQMERATEASSTMNDLINKQLSEAHRQNREVASVMTDLGINPRPTVAEWIKKKQEQKREQLQGTLEEWQRTKQQREMAISIKQAITSHRALQHVAWGIKKDLTAQMKALDDQPKARSRVATTLRKPRHTLVSQQFSSVACNRSRLEPRHLHIKKSTTAPERKFTSSGCVRATPFGFFKIREEGEEGNQRRAGPRRTSSLPDAELWDMGRSYIGGMSQPFYSRLGHRAYGPKTVHAEKTLHFLPPSDYNELKKQSRRSVRSKSLTASSGLHTRQIFTQQSTQVQYHSLADSYPSAKTSPRRTKIASGQVLPMKILDRTEIAAKITA